MVTHTKDNPYLWMRRPVSVGPLPALVLYYHGDLIQADGLFLDLKTSNGWYPSTGLGYGSPVTASFDLTFHTPKKYAFASIGDRVAADTAGDVVTTRWVTKDPTMHASFNIGTFDTYDVKDPRGLPVTVFVNQEAHNQIPPAYQGRSGQIVVIPRQAHMKESVGEDVALALNFFRDAFGEPPAHRFYATEISGGHGQSFPGLIHFSWVTYQGFLLAKGEDEVFRSHEMAHQWWGLGVNPASYRDAWLSEGFAEFAGWWYAEAVVRDSTAMSRILQKSKDALMLRRRAAGPIWLGTRLIGGDVPQDYSLIVYQKGAWVLRMLRYLTLDPDSAGEQPFRLMLRDFYESFRGTQASTADFQDVVQRHVRAPMDWFFNSWVYGTGIPTYVWSQTTEQGGGKATWKLRVTQREVPDDFTMIVPVHLYFRDGRNALLRVMVKGPSTDYSAEVPEKPARVIFNESDAVLAEVKEESWR